MLTELKREAYEANLTLPRHGLVHLTFGNASALDRRRGIFAIKPSGIAYADLRPSDLVLVDLDGKSVEKKSLKPSSDTDTHRRLFLAFPTVGGVVHTHSSCATAFAQAGRSIPVFGTTHADYFANAIPFTRKLTRKEIKGEGYQWAIGDSIVESLQGRDPLALRGTLVNGHAPFTWGQTAADAAEVAVALEWIAHLAILSLQLAPRLAPIDPTLSSRHFLRKHGPTAHYGQHDLA